MSELPATRSRHAWAESDVEELPGGVYRIPLPLPSDGLRAVNVYAITDDHGLSLIDAGMAIDVDREALATALQGIGFGFADVRACYVTHFHRDHYPLAVRLRAEFGTLVTLGEREKANVRRIQDVSAGRAASGLDALITSFGAGHLVAALAADRRETPSMREYEDPDRWLPDGSRLDMPGRTVDVIATPGHTQGHVVFRDHCNALLFAGDHVLPQITPSIGFEPAPTGQALADYLDSLARIRALPDTMLLPAHGPVMPSAHARVEELLAHHEVRLGQSLAACDATWRSGFEVARQLPWTRHERSLDELTDFDQALATAETDAHLRVLVARGVLTGATGEEGVLRYRVTEERVLS